MDDAVTVVNGALTALLVGGGCLVAGGAVRDAFQTLWHPSGKGTLSGWITEAVWRVARRRPSWLDVAGPLHMALVLLTWAVLVLVGFALIYLPWFATDGFIYGPGVSAADGTAVTDALYLSAVTLSTLGFGDVVPREGWLRLVTASEALIGFTLLTAGIAWLTQVQQALVRRRSCARYLSVLRRAEVGGTPLRPTRDVLEFLSRDLAAIHVDLSHATTSYYFRDDDKGGSLALALPWAVELARRGRASADEDVRAAASVLEVALDDVVTLLGGSFLRLREAERDDVLQAYLDDHRRSPL